MEAMDAILSRRSIRRYRPEQVDDQVVEELLEAAMSAPSAGNEQPWHFVVINDRRLLDEVTGYHPYSKMLKEAPMAILVCADPRLARHEGFWVQDCAAATQNILIAARAKGLGACWIGVYPARPMVDATRELLAIPAHVVPVSLVAVGHPAEEKAPSRRYDPSRIHYDRWE